VKNIASTPDDPNERPSQEPTEPPHKIELDAALGAPISFEVPEGTRHITVNIEPRSGGGAPPENSFQSCSRSCGGVVLSCLGVLVIIYILAMLIR
jgi:hypothetical protein